MTRKIDDWNADEQRERYDRKLKLNEKSVIGWSNIPGHCHRHPGIWDWDNRKTAGDVCEQCRRWNNAALFETDNVDLRRKILELEGALKDRSDWYEAASEKGWMQLTEDLDIHKAALDRARRMLKDIIDPEAGADWNGDDIRRALKESLIPEKESFQKRMGREPDNNDIRILTLHFRDGADSAKVDRLANIAQGALSLRCSGGGYTPLDPDAQSFSKESMYYSYGKVRSDGHI